MGLLDIASGLYHAASDEVSDVANDAEDLAGSAVDTVEDEGAKVVSTVEDEGHDLYDKVSSVDAGASASDAAAAPSSTWDKIEDFGETALNTAMPFAEPVYDWAKSPGGEKTLSAAATGAVKGAEDAPGIGTLINGAQSLYRFGSAGYDIATGDRDGAVAQTTQGLVNVAGMDPGIGKVIGGVDAVLGIGGGIAKTYEGATGHGDDTKDVPQSTGDLLSGLAVSATNNLFGKDDSNYFASGDAPTGNREGEIGAGLSTMLSWPLGGGGAKLNADLGNPLGRAVGSVFGDDASTPSSGAGDPSAWQRSGQAAHDYNLKRDEEQIRKDQKVPLYEEKL